MRKNWIDNLRWATVLSVLLYHVFYYYNGVGVFGGIGGFSQNQPQDIVLYILYPWFMFLLFLLAGISSRYALNSRGSRRFFRERTLKLLVPSTIGLLVFQWITGYFNTLTADHVQGGALLSAIPAVARYPSYVISGVGPLWFVQDLWIFSIVALLVKKLDRGDRFCGLCSRLGIVPLILLGILPHLLSQFYVADVAAHPLGGLFNLYRPHYYLAAYLLGYFVFSNDAVQERLALAFRPLILCAVLAGVLLCCLNFGKDCSAPSYLASPLNGLYAYLMSLALLGLFNARFDVQGRFSSYMTKSSYGLYILHYSVCAGVGYWLKVVAGAPAPLCYAVLLAAVFLLTPLLYEILRRIPLLRWCIFGIRPEGRKL